MGNSFKNDERINTVCHLSELVDYLVIQELSPIYNLC